jgi:hypothetical protein
MVHGEFPDVDEGICTCRSAFPAASRIRVISAPDSVGRMQIDGLDVPVEESIADDNGIENELGDVELSDDQSTACWSSEITAPA